MRLEWSVPAGKFGAYAEMKYYLAKECYQMTGVVDVGGGLRGIYGAGVFDYCLDHQVQFDYCIGVSAGSANIASYLGNQKGRNYQFYMEYAFRKQYMSLHNLLHVGSYLNVDYIYGELSNQDQHINLILFYDCNNDDSRQEKIGYAVQPCTQLGFAAGSPGYHTVQHIR